MADAIVSAVSERLIGLLEEQSRYHINLVTGVKKEVCKLATELTTIRNVLDDAENQRFKNKSVKDWLARLEQTSYQMDDVLDEWNYAILKIKIEGTDQPDAVAPLKNKVWSFIPSSSCLCFKKVVVRHQIAHKILDVKEQLDDVLREKDRYNFVLSQPTADPLPKSWRGQSDSLIDLKKVQGRDSDIEIFVSKLIANRGSQEELGFHVLSIVGVGGLGKKTLAQLVYNDGRVEKSFDLRIWICVSDPFDLAVIAREILESIGSSSNDNNLDVLLNKVRESISGKRFLLVLDDVWTEDDNLWEPLKNSLTICGGANSIILVTTRKESVAKIMGSMDDDIHRLGVLSNGDCWLLLRQIALSERNNMEFEGIGKKIAEKCQGLPLAAKTLGSVLCSNNTLEKWMKVLNSEIWELEEAEVKLFPHLLLSYNELSPTLKRCFSYCAVFPKDHEIFVEDLIGYWMALGYLGSEGDMEGRGREYFDILASHSLFQEFGKDDLSEDIIKCKMHDIVHDFTQFLRKSSRVGAAGVNKTTCGANNCSLLVSPHVNELCSLVYDHIYSPSKHYHCLTRLRVFKMDYLESLPERMSNLIHLRWLSLKGYKDLYCREQELKIIFQLYSLQTLRLTKLNQKEIPREIGNLIHLRHLKVKENHILKELPKEIGNLIELRHLDLSWNNSLKELPSEIGNLINLRHLNLSKNSNLEKLPREIQNLSDLRYLNLSRNDNLKELPMEIGNLIHLTCFKLGPSLKELPREIGNLIHLTHLELGENRSLKELPMEIGKLIRLRYLDLSNNHSLKELPKEIGNLIELRHLDLSNNHSLKELPKEIGNLIELTYLDLSNNINLKALPESVCNLRKLQTVGGNHTKILCTLEGLSKLTSLLELRGFNGGCGQSKLGVLKDLNNLGGKLELNIRLADDGLEQVVGEARAAELRNKVHITELAMLFSDDMDEKEVPSSLWMNIIDALEPHPNLQYLNITYYKGSGLDVGWLVSPFNQVRAINLHSCSGLWSLPPLGKLPRLEELIIEFMDGLQYVGPQFLGISRGRASSSSSAPTNFVAFPKLKDLTFRRCSNWKEWEDITAEEEESVALSFMPLLTTLIIDCCVCLTELPHRLLLKPFPLRVLKFDC